MRTVDDFARIRQAHRDGLSARQIAKQLHVGRDTVRKALQHPEPMPYTLAQPRSAPVFGFVREVVDAILAADETAPPKQRHTAAQLHRRLVVEYGYTGSYDQVRRYVQERRRSRRETFIPLGHPPGHRAEADFGHIHVDFPDGRRQVPVLLVTWSFSNTPFALAVPTERTEAVLHGLVEAFVFFGCVPRELWWDNPKTVAVHLFRGRDRTLHPRYAALASHYTFAPKFCLPATATEKPRVEKRVFDLQRQWATPVPRVQDLDALNTHLRQCCVAARDRTSGDQALSVGQRFEQDRAAALPTPVHRFRSVTVKGFVDRVEVVAEGQVIATHARSYGRRDKVLDPLHFLTVLERKPAALDHAPVYRDWHLPPAFAALRQALDERLGPRTGSRHYIRVLQLLAHHPLERVEQAIIGCCGRGRPEATAIAVAVERLACAPLRLPAATTLPLPDLSRFNQFLSHSLPGDPSDERSHAPVTEGQPEAVETANDVGRVGEVGP